MAQSSTQFGKSAETKRHVYRFPFPGTWHTLRESMYEVNGSMAAPSRRNLSLAKNQTASKLERLALCLGLKREPGLVKSCSEEREGSLLGKDVGCTPQKFRTEGTDVRESL
jgi:hypothetical protein